MTASVTHSAAGSLAAGAPLAPTATTSVPVRALRWTAVRARSVAATAGRRFVAALPPLAVLAALIGFWYFATYVMLDARRRFLLPPPHAVLVDGVLDGEVRGEILTALWDTSKVAFTGLFLAIVLGVAVAIAMSQARWIERSLYPWAVVLQTVPILAIVPVIGFWWGFGFSSRVIVCVLIAIFPVITNTLFGLQSAAAGWHDLFALRRAGRLTRLVKLELPAALPATFTGLRIAAGLSVVGAIVGDFFFRQGEPGIGRLIDTYRQQLASEELFAAIAFSSLLGVAVFWVVGAISQRAVGSWHETGMGR